jgi:hypothetical protein
MPLQLLRVTPSTRIERFECFHNRNSVGNAASLVDLQRNFLLELVAISLPPPPPHPPQPPPGTTAAAFAFAADNHGTQLVYYQRMQVAAYAIRRPRIEDRAVWPTNLLQKKHNDIDTTRETRRISHSN